jgi:hypothetical protein
MNPALIAADPTGLEFATLMIAVGNAPAYMPALGDWRPANGAIDLAFRELRTAPELGQMKTVKAILHAMGVRAAKPLGASIVVAALAAQRERERKALLLRASAGDPAQRRQAVAQLAALDGFEVREKAPAERAG